MAENTPGRPGAETDAAAPNEDEGATVPKARAGEPAPEQEPVAGAAAEPASAAEPAKAGAAKGTSPRKPAKKAAAKAARKAAAKAASDEGGTPAKKPATKAAKKATKSSRKATSSGNQITAHTPAEPAAVTPAEPAATTPGQPAPAVPPAAAGAPVRLTPPGAWTAAAWQAVRQFDQPPRRLAELAVAEVGPRAAVWAEWLRQTYPGAPPDGIARLAARQAGRHGRAVALAAAGGPLTAPFCLPAAAWVRVNVVLRTAAAFGHDPADLRRADELIDLLGLGRADPDPAGSGQAGGRIVAAMRRLDHLRLGMVPPLLRRRSPLAALRVLAMLADHGERIERLAHRAVRYYRPGSQSSSEASARSSSSA